MANREHIEQLFRIPYDPKFRHVRFDLQNLDLSGADLRGVNLQQVQISSSNFSNANLDDVLMSYSQFNHCKFEGASLRGSHPGEAKFIGCSFVGASLEQAYMASGLFHSNFARADLRKVTASWADFRRANLDGADLRGAILQNADMPYASLRGTRWENAEVMNTILTGTDMTGATGLEEIRFSGPAVIDAQAVNLSGGLPLKFLRGAELPDEIIDFYQSIPGAIHFHSCFISHADADREFADRLYADLQNRGVRCWYSPLDLKIGARQRNAFNEAIHLHDRLLIILSAQSLQSAWVETEVETALERERNERRDIIFPVRLDNDVLQSKLAWAGEVRRRHIGDFRLWRDHDCYKKELERLVKDLKKTN